MKFEEGQDYSFLVCDRIVLPDDSYLVIESEDGRKFMMKERFYGPEYELASGKKIICRVDKINCSGKIFFEPRHPWLKPGDRGLYTITGEGSRKFKKTDGEYRVYTATGTRSEPAIIKETDNPEFSQFAIGQKVNATIKKISRGEVHLVDVTMFLES